jgi:hypothetical protein
MDPADEPRQTIHGEHIQAPSPQQVRRSPFRGDMAFIQSSSQRTTLVEAANTQAVNMLPIQGNVASILAPAQDVIEVSSDDAPAQPPPKIHPFFVRQQKLVAPQLTTMTHEMRFHAVASSPLRLPQLPQTTPPQHSMSMNTPPRVGLHGFKPRNIFPDSPNASTLSSNLRSFCHTQAQTYPQPMCDAIVQTSPGTRLSQSVSCAQTSPRLYNPLTLADLQREIQSLLIGLGF